MAYSIRDASAADLNNWDGFVANSVNGTLFHRRDFLSYHGGRFAHGEKFLVIRKGNAVVAQVSVFVGHDAVATSPYGGSYGSLVFGAPPSLSAAREIVRALLVWSKEHGIAKLRLTPTPSFCCKQSLDTFAYALLMAGFKSSRREVSSVVELAGIGPDIESALPGKTRNVIRAAKKRGVCVCRNAGLDEVWPLLEMTFNRHGARPTHTKAELSKLIATFPGEVNAAVARQDGINLAGIVEFSVNSRVQSSFYFCRSEAPSQGLSVLVADALDRAIAEGYRFYDFGTSTVNMQARDSVFLFKEGFGATGYFRETFEWDKGGECENSTVAD